MVEVLRKIRSKSFGLKNSQDFIACHKTYLCNTMWISQDHTDLWGSQTLLGKFVDLLLHVVRRQLQPGGNASPIRQCRLGQALPGSMHATHDGGVQAAEKRAKTGRRQEATSTQEVTSHVPLPLRISLLWNGDGVLAKWQSRPSKNQKKSHSIWTITRATDWPVLKFRILWT